MSVVDSFSDTDPPGYRIDLIDDGTVHITGHGMDQTLPAEQAQSAEGWYQQNAFAFLPLPLHVARFVEAAKAAGRALGYAASAVVSGVAEEMEVTAFASAVSEALIASCEACVPFGIGGDVLGLATTIAVNAGRARPAAEGALASAWNGLDGAIDFFSLAEHAQQDRAVSEDARSLLQNFAVQAERAGEATRALLDL